MSADAPPDARRAAIEPVFAAARAGELAQARQLAIDALAKGHEHPVLLNLRALDHEEQGRLDQSLADLRRAHILAPGDFSILNACGLCLARMERPQEALQCYDQALAIRPDFAAAWFNSGWALEQLGETAKAAQAYVRAAELNPQNAQAWANAAWMAARRGDAAGARLYADKTFAIAPGHATALLALANAEVADDPGAAEQRLRPLAVRADLGDYDRAIALGQLGDALDALDRPADAFAAYTAGNRLFARDAAPRFDVPGLPTAGDTLGWLVAWARGLDAGRWASKAPPEPSRGGERAHVFLLGFPRSGTTLMETALGAHPDVATLEERNTLQAAVRAFLTDANALSRLAGLSERELQPFRDDYWASVAAFDGRPAGKIFIDKNPFNTSKLPLIYKLFPEAKIIFAVRDPRDVVLSGFRRRFNLNPSTYELLNLRRAAVLYDSTMRLAEILRDKQPMAEHRLVYERLVEDFEGEVRAALAFIGADWLPELLDFADRAKRGDVASASSAQIARGLYQDGVGQWRRYRTELAPILPTLAPWVERFGYPAD